MNRIATYYRHLWRTEDSPVMFAVLVKGVERYVFSWDDDPESLRQVLRTCGRFASDPELSFTWGDAAILSQHMRTLQ